MQINNTAVLLICMSAIAFAGCERRIVVVWRPPAVPPEDVLQEEVDQAKQELDDAKLKLDEKSRKVIEELEDNWAPPKEPQAEQPSAGQSATSPKVDNPQIVQPQGPPSNDNPR